jgi:hypothetical protein
MAQSKKLFYKTLIFMPNYLRKSTNFKIEAKKILILVCSATTPVSYPASLRNFPNGYKGHPRIYPPPERPPIAKPDPNSVRTRCSFLFNYGMG